MQIDALLQTTLRLAGYMAARGCVALQGGQDPGVDIGRVRDDGSLQAEALATGFGDALERGRGLLAEPGAEAQALVHLDHLELPDTPLQDALVAEFGGEPRLAGLVVALPFVLADNGRRLAIRPLRFAACPAALRPHTDELMRCFVQGLASMPQGFAAWMRALEADTTELPQAPADLRDPQALALAIRVADQQPDSGSKAATHLQAFLDHADFEGGLAFEKLLRECAPDLSLQSLARLDALLDRLHAERRPQAAAFMGAQSGRNLLNLLAVWLGETLADAADATATWVTSAQFERADPGRLDAEPDAATALLCVFNAAGPRTGLPFLALDVVAGRLFGKPGAPTLTDAAQAALPAIRAARRPAPPVIDAAWRASAGRDALVFATPHWAARDVLARWFEDLPRLAAGGRVVWARLVQANNMLFSPGPHDHPGEVVFDPGGRLAPDDLDVVGHRIFELKGTRPRHPGLAFLAASLMHEMARTRGFPVPASLGARGLLVSTLVFHRAHLPNGRLTGHLFPVVVADDAPGAAAVLPSEFWPPELLAEWLEG